MLSSEITESRTGAQMSNRDHGAPNVKPRPWDGPAAGREGRLRDGPASGQRPCGGATAPIVHPVCAGSVLLAPLPQHSPDAADPLIHGNALRALATLVDGIPRGLRRDDHARRSPVNKVANARGLRRDDACGEPRRDDVAGVPRRGGDAPRRGAKGRGSIDGREPPVVEGREPCTM